MKNKDLAFISIRILSLYIFTKALLGIGSIVNLMITQIGIGIIPVKQLVFTFLNSFGLAFVISILLWVFADKISSLVIGKKENLQEGHSKITLKSIQAIAISTVGLIIIVSGLPELVKVILDYNFAISQFSTTDPNLKLMTTYKLIEVFVKLALGLGLFIGANKITDKLRNLSH